MAKLNLKDATKELATEAGNALNEAIQLHKTADGLMAQLRDMEKRLIRQREEAAAQQKREEEQRAMSSHSRAYTSESGFVTEEVPVKTEVSAPADSANEAVAEVPAEAVAAAPEKIENPAVARQEEVPAAREPQPAPEHQEKEESVRKPVEQTPEAEKADKPVAAEPQKPQTVAKQPQQKPAVSQKQEEAKPAARKPEQPKTAEVPAEPVKAEQPKAEPKKPEAPKPEPVREAPKADKPKRPVIGQIISRPGDPVPQQKPVGLAPNVIRVAKPAEPRPQQRPQQGNRPQGTFGQGPQARPGNAPFNRPGQPQRPQNAQGAGPYGRAPQGQPRPQGQFGRPAPGAGNAQRPQQGGTFGGNRNAQAGGGSFGQSRPGGNRPSRNRVPEMVPTMEKERVSNYDPNKKNYVRQHDPEHISRNRKQEAKNNFNGYDDDVIRGGRKARKKPSVQQTMAPIKIETAYMSGDMITVRDLTERIGKTAGEIIKQLMILGNMATINSEIDFDTASLVCQEFGITLEKKAEKTAEDQLVEENFEDDEDNLISRPPVVTIMGHVDHGKTSLLDYIRKSRVTASEAGGITQHIGAYTVKVDDRQITFLDTPGHEAFTAMRARGAQATDIAVLVVAADDSVMPQTVEAINHAKAADVPMIVAINKMDKPAADPERVKQDLTKYDVVCEEWGGDTICVPVSAATGAGVDELLEMILLQADMLQLRANPNRLGRGVIIEAKLDKARGPLATVLLQNGTLHVGDNIIAGMASGRVRALINDRGEKVKEAGPSMPVEIMGFDEVPSAGDEMIAVGDDHLSRQVAEERREKLRASREATAAKMTMENLFSSIEEGKITTLNLIIKADVQGSVEAVKQAMEKLTNDEVRVRVLHSGAGAITKDDVNLASAFNAIIIGFNIRPDASAREQAEKEKVDIRLYTIIYKAIEDMELAMKGMLAPEYREVLLGHAEVRNVFKITGAGIIAGCYVQDGKVQRNANVRLLRDNVVVFEGKLSSLRHLKDDVKEMAAGYECGMSLEGHNDIKEGDIVECFIMEEIPR